MADPSRPPPGPHGPAPVPPGPGPHPPAPAQQPTWQQQGAQPQHGWQQPQQEWHEQQQQGWPGQSGPGQGGQQGHPTQQQAVSGKRRPVGPLLMILSVVVTVGSTFMTWNHGSGSSSSGGISMSGGEAWNGWDQALVNIGAGRVYGYLMILAFAIAFLGCIGAIVVAILGLATGPSGNALGVFAVISAVVALLGTFAMLLGYVGLGALHEMDIGGWVYGFAFFPGLVGAIGMKTKKY